MEQKYDVFISYARKDYVDDKDKVIPGNKISKIKDLLTKNGITYWFDEEGIYSGNDFASDITVAIRNSNIFLFISSENSNQSIWTSNEISTAWEYHKPIIPFLLDDSPFNDSIMGKIASLDRIRCVNENKALQKLLRSIQHHLSKELKDEPQETIVSHTATGEGSSIVKSVQSQETTHTNDFVYSNELSITITDHETPIVVFVGPSHAGKTMAFIRLVRYLEDLGLSVKPDRFFHSAYDSLYVNICNSFHERIYSDIASPSTEINDCILTTVTDAEGRSLIQMVDLSGEFILHPDKTPHYWYQIVRSKNPIIWAIFAEMNGMSVDERKRYVQRIAEIRHRFISSTDKTIIIASKIDKSPFVLGKSQFNLKEIFNTTRTTYPGLMEMFIVSKPFKHYDFTFIPFTSGDFTYDISRYVPSSDVYPKMLWEALLKSKKNGVGPHKIIQWIIFAISIIAIVLASIFGWRHFHHTAPLNPIAIEDTICSPIDLDLPSGTLWADRNVGANMSTDFGDLFAWGETEPKNDYSRYNYVEQLMPSIQISKAKHDAALSQLGPDWSMPTEKQFEELLSECTWKWAQMNGNKGYKITGKNGQQIFLPAAGCSHDTIVEFRNKYGFYWTSKRSTESRYARSLQFSNEGKRSIENGYLHYGYSIRAVYTEENK